MEESCRHVGDIVNQDTEWRRIGEIRERNEDSWRICNIYDIYSVAIPAKMDFDTAKEMCHKLGRGNITEPRSERGITKVASQLQKMNSSCKYVWTPISDEEVEGEFRSSITGDIATFQPWAEAQPNGGDAANNVAIILESKLLNDAPKYEEFCSACDLHKTLVFSLIGVCKHTYFGKQGVMAIMYYGFS